MEWLNSLKKPETLFGTAGAYGLYASSPEGNKLYVGMQLAPTLGRKDGQNYNAVGLLVRLLFAGADPKTVDGLEVRETKAYHLNSIDGEEVWVKQLNKMLFPIATVNVGSEAMQALLQMHFESLTELLAPFMEANGLKEDFPMATIFEGQNPAVYLPVVAFDPPKTIKSWQETLDEIKASAKAGFVPKNTDYKAPPTQGDTDV